MNKRLIFNIIAGFVFVLFLSVGSYTGVQAATCSNPIFYKGRGQYCGYFTNTRYGGSYSDSSNVLPNLKGYFLSTTRAICNNEPINAHYQVNGEFSIDAIPSCVNSVSRLMSVLKMYNGVNGHATAQTITGSAFIVYTMLGRNGSNYNRTISDSDWTALENRMNGSSINWNAWGDNRTWGGDGDRVDSFYSGPENTIAGNWKDDDEFYKGGPVYDAYGGYQSGPAIIFYNSGRISYTLFRWCANPGGSLAGLPPQWNLSATSSANKITALPGDTITWTHHLINNGTDATTTTIHSNLLISGFSNGWERSGDLSGGDVGAGAGVGVIRNLTNYATYTVTQNDVGKTLCQLVRFDPFNNNGGRNGQGNNSCVNILYSYSLTPSVSTNTGGVVEIGTAINVSPVVSKTGTTKSAATQWQLTKTIVLPNNTIPNPSGGISASLPCVYFGSASASCSVVNSSSNVNFNLGNNSLAIYPDVAGDYAAGTKICFALSVQPHANSIPSNGNDSQWAHSVPVCMVIGKKPKVQLWGGNLFAGGSVGTGTSTKNISGADRTFGSWVEYGIFATGLISGTASGSAFAGPGLVSSSVCDYSTLSFTSAGDSICTPTTTKGSYTTTGSLPNIAASFPGGATIPASTVVANDLISSSGVYVGNLNGDLTLNQSQLDPGKSIILKVSGTVTIAGNQTYNPDNNGAKYKFISELPQLVIVANKIIINDTVTNIDGWLVANGTDGIVETCNTGSSTYALSGGRELTTNKCSSLLTVNGPVIAKQLWLRRTAGSGPGIASGDPAEIFNLRADTYLWTTARAISSSRIQTVYATELPPRF